MRERLHPLGLPAPGEVPLRKGAHRILQQIGRGAAGRTYLALSDSSTHESTILVCIKAPAPALAHDPRYIADFENEARMASLLTHPHILRLNARGVDELGHGFLVYPFVEGLDLGELIAGVRDNEEQLAWEVVATIALQLAKALEYAHTDTRGSGRLLERPPILHRDICPQNILIALSGVCYLIDFGIAKALGSASLIPSLAGSGRLLYSAPERLLEGRTYDARADLFSLGIVLFEALTNERPYDSSGSAAYLRQVLSGHRPNIRDARAEYLYDELEVTDGLEMLVGIVQRLLEPDPDLRFPSAGALVEALGRIPLDHTAHLEIVRLVEDHRPAWRRNVRLRAGAPPSTHTPSGLPTALAKTDPRQLTATLAAEPQVLEHDLVRVSPEGARRLLAQRHIPLGTTRPGYSTNPSAHVSLETTVPDLPSTGEAARGAPGERRADRAGRLDEVILTPPPFENSDPSIPPTRDGAPTYDLESLRAQHADASSSQPLHDQAADSTHPHPFTQAATRHPAFDADALHKLRPAPASARNRRRLALIVAALVVAFATVMSVGVAIVWMLIGR